MEYSNGLKQICAFLHSLNSKKYIKQYTLPHTQWSNKLKWIIDKLFLKIVSQSLIF